MIKVKESYSKTAGGRHEVTQQDGTTSVYTINGSATNGVGARGPVSNGTLVSVSQGSPTKFRTSVGGISENSAIETHEHYERKVQRVKKSRSDRDRAAGRSRSSHKERWEGVENGRHGGRVQNGSSSLDRHSAGIRDDLIRRLELNIGIINEKLDGILYRIEEAESHVKITSPQRMREIVDAIVYDLNALERPIDELFTDVETLKEEHHPRHNEFYVQVFGLHQRRMAYLDRCNAEFNRIAGLEGQNRIDSEKYMQTREKLFTRVEECIKWVEERLEYMSEMQFPDDIQELEQIFEQHKVDHRDVYDFRHQVDQCIALQAEISAEDSAAYCDLLTKLEKEYAQLRELSSGRMLDLDSLLAFIRAAHLELIWVSERETLEVSRNWSDINQLDLPMLQNYYKQLLHEIELREEQYNTVHNQGAALLNQGHPAVGVIEAYVHTMQTQWDWLLCLTQCLEIHLQDALNLHQFMEDARTIEQWMQKQMQLLNERYDRSEFSVEEGERMLRELEEMREVLDRYHEVLLSLVERSRIISPLWQRGERIPRPIPVLALCNFTDGEISIRKGDECILLNNNDMVNWLVRSPEGREGVVPSVVFRLPPPDERIFGYLQRLQAEFDRLRRLWIEKNRMIRFYMILKAIREIRGWDLKHFLSLDPDQREAIIKAVNDDAAKFLSELDPNDPLGLRLREELRLMNEHLMKLMQMGHKDEDTEASAKFDEKLTLLLPSLEEYWRVLNQRVAAPIPKDLETWEKLIIEHKTFEDALQALESEIIMVQELFRQIPNPTLMQRAKLEQLLTLWENLWQLCKWYAERLKASEPVLNGIAEATHYINEHELRLSSSGPLPADLDKLRALHSELLEIQLTLQQQQPILDDLTANVVRLRQHVAGTRLNVATHPDVDQLEEDVQRLVNRWENICANVMDRLKSVELAMKTMLIYRPSYDNEISWLDRVEATINNLRDPSHLRPEEYQEQLEILISEYAQLQERTSAIEKVNHEGGRFIRDAKVYDVRIVQYRDLLEEIRRGQLAKITITTISGAEQVQKELDELNRRFSQLSSIILERRNILQVLMQNYKKKKADDDEEEARRRRREEEERRRREEEERRRREEEERRRREEEERRRREEEERRRREEEERLKKKPEPVLPIKTGDLGIIVHPGGETIDTEWTKPIPEQPKISEHEDDMTFNAEETLVRTKFYDLDAIKHMQTGEILTFVEAVRQGLLDLHAGEFFDSVSSARISLQEAVERKIIPQSFSDCLNTRYGIHDPTNGDDLTLLEAIQREVYDPEVRQLRDPTTGDAVSVTDATSLGIVSLINVPKLIKHGILKLPPMNLEHAIEQKVIDIETGTFVGRYSHETLPLRDALRNGYITVSSPLPPQIAMGLTECIESRFVNPSTGEFLDKNTNEKFTLRDAVSKANSLINLNIREIINTNERKRITVGEALVRNVLNTRQGNFTDLAQRQSMSIQEAHDKDFIQKPLTLKEIYSKDLVDSVGRFIDGGTKKRMSLLEAIAEGVIDADVPHIVEPESREILSIGDALENGVLNPDGSFVAPGTYDTITIHDAARHGWLTDRVKSSIFDVKGIRNTKTKQMLSYNEAVDAGIINPQSERFVDLHTNQNYYLEDTAEKVKLVDAPLHTIFSAVSGIKSSRGTDMNVFQAAASGAINTKKHVFVDKRTNQEMSPREAYDRGLISLKGAMQLTALFNVSPTLVAAGRPKKVIKKEVKRGTTPTGVNEEVKTAIADILRPGSAEGPTIQESLTEQVTETSHVLAPKHTPDKQSQETVTTVKRKKIKETTATGGPGGAVLYRAITSGKNSLEVPLNGFHVMQCARHGLLDLKSGSISLPDSERQLNFEEAIDLGIIDAHSATVRNPKTGAPVTLSQAVELGILDASGSVVDNRSGRRVSLQEAISSDYITLAPEPHIDSKTPMKVIQFGGVTAGAGPVMSFTPIGTSAVEESETSWSFDTNTGELYDKFTGQRMRLDDAVRQNKISTDLLKVKDAVTEKVLSYSDAVKWGIVDPHTNRYHDKMENRDFSLQDAIRRGAIFLNGGGKDSLETHVHQKTRKVVASKEAAVIGPAAFVDYSLKQVLDLGWYDSSTGLFTHPSSKKQMSLKESIMKGLFNPYESVVVDQRTNETTSLLDAIQSGKIDANNGTILDHGSGQHVNLHRAFEIGLIKSGIAPQSLKTIINNGSLNLKTGEVRPPEGGSTMLLHEAIARGVVDPNSISVKDPQSGTDMKFGDAVRSKVIDVSRGLLINKSSGEATTFLEGVITGVIRPTDATGSFTPKADQHLPVVPSRSRKQKDKPTPGQREELVDVGGKQVMVKVVKDELGAEKGEYIDQSTGMKFTVQLHGDPYVTRTKTTVKSTAQVQQVELDSNAEFVAIDQIRDNRTGRIMTLAEAQRAGLAKVDKKGKQLTKTYAVFRSDIVRALNEGIVDPVKGDRLSLADGIRAKLVDIKNLTYSNPVSGEEVNFVQAANMGLMDLSLAEVLPRGVCNPASGERISIARAIEMKIINPRTGEVMNPFTNQRITWLDLVKPVYASLTMEGVYDPRKGYAVPVISALNEGLLNPKTESYYNPITKESLPLKEAVKIGLIDEATYRAVTESSIPDWRSHSKISLLKAVDIGLVDPQQRTVQLDKGVVIPIAKAVEDGKIPRDVGARMKRVDKLTFAEALGQGLIDVRSNTFTDPDSGKRMTVSQALDEGFVDTGNVQSVEGADEKNLVNVIESEEFDTNSGRIREKKSGLYLTFRQAIDNGLIDGDSLVYDVDNSCTMTIREAVERGRIDSNGKYVDQKSGSKINLKDAVRVGLLALIASPMMAGQAVAEAVKRRETEGFKFKIERMESPSVHTPGGRVVEEEIVTTYRASPVRAEPMHSLKIKTDDASDRLRSLMNDPQAIADRQYEFMESLKRKDFDVEDRIIENPSTGQRISTKEAVETGVLDVLTGEIVNLQSGRHYSIPRAVHMKMVQPSAAKNIMESLNLSLEELHHIIQTLSPRSDYSPRSMTSSTFSLSPESGGVAYTKEVTWRGHPAELRDSHGDLSQFTTVSGSRGGPVDESGNRFSDPGSHTTHTSYSYRVSEPSSLDADNYATIDDVRPQTANVSYVTTQKYDRRF